MDSRYGHLNDSQRHVAAEFLAGGGSLADLLKAEENAGNLTRHQSAQLADAIQPGAGAEYLR